MIVQGEDADADCVDRPPDLAQDDRPPNVGDLRIEDRQGKDMNGAQSLIQTLINCKVDTCFANPGTSEMHFVAALDSVPEMRPVLCLFEGVATGAADGYGRIAGKPAATLLHPGLAVASRTCTTRVAPARRW
jgi:hypothetical protein